MKEHRSMIRAWSLFPVDDFAICCAPTSPCFNTRKRARKHLRGRVARRGPGDAGWGSARSPTGRAHARLRALWSSLACTTPAIAGCRSVGTGKARRCARRGTPRGPLVRTGHRSRSCSHCHADRRVSSPAQTRVEPPGYARGTGYRGSRGCACSQRPGRRCGELTTAREVRADRGNGVSGGLCVR